MLVAESNLIGYDKPTSCLISLSKMQSKPRSDFHVAICLSNLKKEVIVNAIRVELTLTFFDVNISAIHSE